MSARGLIQKSTCLDEINSNRYSTFLANRIAKLQQMLPADKWKHAPIHQKPVDKTTRPVAAAEL